MEFMPPPPSPSSLSVGKSIEKAKDVLCSAVSKILSVLFTFVFALVGILLGAMTGALLGQETECGFVRGAAVGAVSGAVFSIEVFEASLAIWHSDEAGIGCILYLVDVVASLVSGRLVREQIGPTIMDVVQSQMGTVESRFDEVVSLFDTCDPKGLPVDSVEKIPKMKISSRDNVDASGESVSCLVCLQDLQLGEMVRCLPRCDHMFHLACIDKWLLGHGSCPLCRSEIGFPCKIV